MQTEQSEKFLDKLLKSNHYGIELPDKLNDENQVIVRKTNFLYFL